jgi:hypothetical protein
MIALLADSGLRREEARRLRVRRSPPNSTSRHQAILALGDHEEIEAHGHHPIRARAPR